MKKLLFRSEKLYSKLFVMTILLIFSVSITASFGLLAKNIYTPFALPKYVQESRAQDFISLVLGIPALVTALVVVKRGKAWGLALWLGVLAYELYVYAIYVFGAVYNICFLGYVACAGLSLYSIIFILAGVNLNEFRKNLKDKLPEKPIALYFFAIVLIFAAIWVSTVLKSIQSGIVDSGHLIFAIDLMIVLPAFGIAAKKMLFGDAFGYLLAGLLLIKFDSLCVSIILGQFFRYLNQIDIETELLFVFVPLGILSIILSGIYFNKYQSLIKGKTHEYPNS